MSTPSAGLSKEYDHIFKLDEGSLRKLNDILKSHAAKIEGKTTLIRFSVYRQDDSFYESDDIDAVLEDENCKTRRIKRLVIRISEEKNLDNDPKDDRSLCYIDFDLNDHKPVRIQIRGENRDWCFLLFQDIDAIIEKVSAGRFMAFLSIPTAQMSICLLLALAIATMIAYTLGWFAQLQLMRDPMDPAFGLKEAFLGLQLQIRISYMAIITFTLFLFLGFFNVGPFIKRTLGGAVFYWGDQIAAYNRRRDLLRNLFWVVVVGLILSFVAAKLFGH